MDLREDPAALQRLKETTEKAKVELSSSTQTEINLPYVTHTHTLTHTHITPCKTHTTSDIDEVILVGGSTRIPVIQEVVQKYFGKSPF